MIKNWQQFNEMATEYKDGNLKVIYRDDKVTVVVPNTLKASIVSCRGTKWCSNDKSGFDIWTKEHILFRFLFKDGYKLRLTWRYREINKGSMGTWGCGGEKYTEISFSNNPFKLDQRIIKNIKEEYRRRIETPFLYNNEVLSDYDFDGKKTKEYYNEWFQTKMNIIKRVKMISPEVAKKVTEYRDTVMRETLPTE